MKVHTRMFFVRLIALSLIIVFAAPFHAAAAVIEPIEPQASYYLESYQTYIYPAGNGEIQVWFHVTGTTDMDDIGALSIKIFEASSSTSTTWTHVKTFLQENESDMLAHDTFAHMSHVTYQAKAGKYYKAYVCFWAGNDTGWDRRYVWTSIKKAT